MILLHRIQRWDVSRRGFTLIELLVSVALICVISGIVIVAINPKKNLTSAYDTRRTSDAGAVGKALYANLIDEWELAGGGKIEEGEDSAKPICKEQSSNNGTCPATAINLNDLPPEYIAQIPIDPVMPESDLCTGYMVYTQAGRPKVRAANLGKLPGDDPAPEALCGAGVGTPTFVIPACNGQTATVYVDGNGIIVGGGNHGIPYVAGTTHLTGSNQADVIVGTSGNDIIEGGNGNDTICGGEGDDQIFGGNGHDIIFGEGGNDTINGDSGSDNGNDVVCGGDGNDVIYTYNGNDSIDGGAGTDAAYGGNGTDICRNAETLSSCENTTSAIPACGVY